MDDKTSHSDLGARMARMAREAQDMLCRAVEEIDGTRFQENVWEAPDGRGTLYRDRALQEGNVFEKVGINAAIVRDVLSPELARVATGQKLGDTSVEFFATGVSLVIHPHNPMAPSVHANYRYFELVGSDAPGSFWFGGGCDLTPAYLFEDDVVHFHRVHKEMCDRHDPAFYPRFKRWCDEYFHLPHRGETRGVGGIFFDRLNDRDPERLFDFVSDGARSFLSAYLPIIERRKDMPFTEAHKRWQQLRRGRYVEFNLIHDRGTAFGLKTGGRTESILMSLPVTARWQYDHRPETGSEEAKLLDVLKRPRDWVQ